MSEEKEILEFFKKHSKNKTGFMLTNNEGEIRVHCDGDRIIIKSDKIKSYAELFEFLKGHGIGKNFN